MIKIKANNKTSYSFNFELIKEEQLLKVMQHLDIKEAALYGCIPARLLKRTKDIHLKCLLAFTNHCIDNTSFSSELKRKFTGKFLSIKVLT